MTSPDATGVTGGSDECHSGPSGVGTGEFGRRGCRRHHGSSRGLWVGFAITPETSFEFSTEPEFAPLGGTIEHEGTVTLGVIGTDVSVTVGAFTIGFDAQRISETTSGFFVLDNEDLDIILFDVGTRGSLALDDSSLSIGEADLLVSAEFADFLLNAELAEFDATGADAGDAQIDADIADIALRRVEGGKRALDCCRTFWAWWDCN